MRTIYRHREITSEGVPFPSPSKAPQETTETEETRKVHKCLHRHVRLPADIPEHRGGYAVCAVSLGGVKFQHDTAVHIRAVHRIRLVRIIGVYRVAVVRGYHEAVRQMDQIVFP